MLFFELWLRVEFVAAVDPVIVLIVNSDPFTVGQLSKDFYQVLIVGLLLEF